MRPRLTAPAVLAVLAITMVAAGCGKSEKPTPTGEPVTLTIVTHDSFAVSEAVLDQFTADTGIEVKILPAGDAGAALNQAILTKDNPEGDVFFGVDNNFLTRALDEELFVAYESPALDGVDPAVVLDGTHHVTPIDTGDVCLNFDKAFFAENDLEPPATLDDLADAAYKDLLVVENPATSSPGLAFLLATVDEYGEDGFADYWSLLRANGVTVAEGWEEAYYGDFSGSAGSAGDRPVVVSYASSPPAEVVFATEPLDEAPTGVIADSCYRQIEFAGILSGTEHEAEAQQLIDFMLSDTFQADIPLNMFVFPVVEGVDLPPEFVEFTEVPTDPFEIDPETVGANRDEWIDIWTDVVIR